MNNTPSKSGSTIPSESSPLEPSTTISFERPDSRPATVEVLDPERDTSIGEEVPEFEATKLLGLDVSEAEEVQTLVDIMDAGEHETDQQRNRLARLLCKATGSTFAPDTIKTWRKYRLSEAYDYEMIFTNYPGFAEWWRVVAQKSLKHEPPVDKEGADDTDDITADDEVEVETPSEKPKMTGGKTVSPEMMRLLELQYKDTNDEEDHQTEQEDSPVVGEKRSHAKAFDVTEAGFARKHPSKS